MRIVDLSQRSAAWYAWRRNGISASEVATILGRCPHKTRWRLWAEKMGKAVPDDLSRNPNVRRGVRLEDWVRQRVEQRHNDILLPVCCESSENPLFRASLDGITTGGEPVEMKAPHVNTYRDVLANLRASEAYQLYWPQVQHQIYVTGSEQGYLCFLCLDVDEGEPIYVEFKIERDEEFIRSQLIPESEAFWVSIQTGKEPKKDPERDIYVPEGDILAQWQAVADERKRLAVFLENAKSQVANIERRLQEKDQGLVALMGDFLHAEACDLRVVRFTRQGSVDWKALVGERLPTLDQETIERYRRPPGDEQIRIYESSASGRVAEREQEARNDLFAATAREAEPLPKEGVYNW